MTTNPTRPGSRPEVCEPAAEPPVSASPVELTIGKGRGYVAAEDNKPKDAPLGYIPVDAIYTPIKNVKYSIENTRVEQRTDYEKLLMDVSTDGTIHPEEAVKQASRILIQHLMIITDENITFDNREEKKEELLIRGRDSLDDVIKLLEK